MDRTSTDLDYMIGNNIYYNSGWKYVDDGYGSIITLSDNGTIEFSTSISGIADATATISNKMYINNDGKVGLSTTSPTSILDIIGTNGYEQLRLRTSYTPTGSGDTNGEVGDIAWDDDYFYLKTSGGWKRIALDNTGW